MVDEVAWKSAPGYRPDSFGGGTADYREVTASKGGGEVMRLSVNLADGLVESGREEAIGKPIEDVVGKEIATQILESESGSVSGDAITIGGKGMTDFYDKILVNAANKLGKKFGARVGSERLEFREARYADDPTIHAPIEPIHTLPITPELAAKAREGFPMFSRSPSRYAQIIDKFDPVKKLTASTWEDEQLRKGLTKEGASPPRSRVRATDRRGDPQAQANEAAGEVQGYRRLGCLLDGAARRGAQPGDPGARRREGRLGHERRRSARAAGADAAL